VKSEEGVTVIVSHDINLATEYGDRIVLIKKEFRDPQDESSSFGVLNNKGVFTRNDENWVNNEGSSLSKDELSNYLKDQLK
jgi:ABC-type cobalamin/Fe3+-siderophores transport system ATPase subunit